MIYDLIVAGGGAAGFFAAIQASELKSGLKVMIVEKSPKVLSKVRVSGGGRCNVTHSCFDPIQLSSHYPRGEKFLKQIFKVYQVRDVTQWFADNGVELKTEDDGRMFPVTDDSQTIIECLMRNAISHKIRIELSKGVKNVEKKEGQFVIHFQDGASASTKKFLVATGGTPTTAGYEWLAQLGLKIVSPVPSLFTFNHPAKTFTDLMGISVPEAYLKIAGTKFVARGPVLITHWGLSGPAVIRLSAWAAIYLNSVEYNFTVLVSWIGHQSEENLRAILLDLKQTKGKQKIFTNPLFNLSLRLWQRLCTLSDIHEEKIWGEVSQKSINRLVEFLIRCPFEIKGKTTFKEEFVTCGGVDLDEVNVATMESKKISGLYFAGEILNIDGETGGFNFQAAWSTAAIAARSIASG